MIASHLNIESGLDKHDRVIRTMKKLDGNVYINPIGGVALYDENYFRQHGIKLRFHRMHEIKYRQHGNDFVPNLSIIDVLMFNSQAELQKMLQRYSLVDNSGNPI